MDRIRSMWHSTLGRLVPTTNPRSPETARQPNLPVTLPTNRLAKKSTSARPVPSGQVFTTKIRQQARHDDLLARARDSQLMLAALAAESAIVMAALPSGVSAASSAAKPEASMAVPPDHEWQQRAGRILERRLEVLKGPSDMLHRADVFDSIGAVEALLGGIASSHGKLAQSLRSGIVEPGLAPAQHREARRLVLELKYERGQAALAARLARLESDTQAAAPTASGTRAMVGRNGIDAGRLAVERDRLIDLAEAAENAHRIALLEFDRPRRPSNDETTPVA